MEECSFDPFVVRSKCVKLKICVGLKYNLHMTNTKPGLSQFKIWGMTEKKCFASVDNQ